MTTEPKTPNPPNESIGWFSKFLATVEWLGNLLPHPITLFALFCVFIVVFSGIAAFFDMSVIDPRPLSSAGREADGVIEVISLFSGEGLRRIVAGLVTNFTGFAPLGTVLVAMYGATIGEIGLPDYRGADVYFIGKNILYERQVILTPK